MNFGLTEKIHPSPPRVRRSKGQLIFVLIALGFLLPVVSGCDYGRMYDQEDIKTYGAQIPEMPQETIPIGGGIQILKTSDSKNLKNPLTYGKKSVDRGNKTYFFFCVQCHGPNADGNGTVGQSFAPLPANLAGQVVQGQSDGELFYKISLGYRRHPPLATTISEEDRWAVVNYLRSLGKKSAG